MPKEKFKKIPIFPNYEINRFGTIRNKKSKKIISTPSINNCGYRLALLTRNKKRYCKSVHRLMAITFLGLEEDSKLTVDHIDRDKLNNNLENLRVVTFSQNMLNKKHKRKLHNIRKVNNYKSKPWEVRFVRNKKIVHNSYHSELKEAIKIRNSLFTFF